ncbi:hypothetical protein MALG_02584 [Marinovum algicola DG 898]|nr:hypothetical protein MALG_02584 [Marinovum algicola DG 898]
MFLDTRTTARLNICLNILFLFCSHCPLPAERRRTHRTRQKASQVVFDYIEIFYSPKHKHTRNGMLSPLEFERQQKLRHEGV